MTELIGARIKQKRIEQKMTQNQVAEKLYVTQQTVARWEKDKHNPPIQAVQDLSELFHVKPSYFFGENQIKTYHFNFYAFLGSLVFNFLFFCMIVIILLPIILTIWVMAGAFLIAPGVIIWQVVESVKSFNLLRLLVSFVMFIVGTIMLPIIWKITKYLWNILKAYYRYNINSIIYEVVPRTKSNNN
ncbi:helix-turn-helix domain-containing protein [Companilactobacillus kimchiensis]|uniref:XRE family transcriptional regulator n=1 Tax=Companilactobacillus kimchiensis TaxID=993692 RepID=A0A0R2LFV3_9LACO|nr:helix-turn-helix domain-containing protein [Companilactobacillus kimchiensis]KRO00792.1 XRE family transcriptional regulator [Companilactobacillus kimchiensis]